MLHYPPREWHSKSSPSEQFQVSHLCWDTDPKTWLVPHRLCLRRELHYSPGVFFSCWDTDWCPACACAKNSCIHGVFFSCGRQCNLLSTTTSLPPAQSWCTIKQLHPGDLSLAESWGKITPMDFFFRTMEKKINLSGSLDCNIENWNICLTRWWAWLFCWRAATGSSPVKSILTLHYLK